MFVVYAMLAYLGVSVVVAYLVLRRPWRKRQGQAGADPDGRAPVLHRVSLRGRPLRFYRSPLLGPDFPWTVLRDLFEVATDGASYNISAEWIYANNPNLAQVVRTSDGPELLLSHWTALELAASLMPDAQERARLVAEFRESMAEAYVLQWAGLSREEFLGLCDTANRRPR